MKNVFIFTFLHGWSLHLTISLTTLLIFEEKLFTFKFKKSMDKFNEVCKFLRLKIAKKYFFKNFNMINKIWIYKILWNWNFYNFYQHNWTCSAHFLLGLLCVRVENEKIICQYCQDWLKSVTKMVTGCLRTTKVAVFVVWD